MTSDYLNLRHVDYELCVVEGQGILAVLIFPTVVRGTPLWTAHSVRKASIGSMRDARRAGTAHARRPTPTSANQTSAKVGGSMGLTPYRKPESARARRSSCPASSAGNALRFAWKSTAEEE